MSPRENELIFVFESVKQLPLIFPWKRHAISNLAESLSYFYTKVRPSDTQSRQLLCSVESVGEKQEVHEDAFEPYQDGQVRIE